MDRGLRRGGRRIGRRRRRRQPDVYSDRRTGPDTSGRSGIRLRCGAVVAGTIIGSRASELVAPGRHSGWCTHLAAVADGTRAARWTTAVAGTSSGRAFCYVLPTTAAADCLRRTAQAFDNHNLAWWSTGALILIAALLARRSRIAAWAAIPAALAGCQLATYFLNQIVLHDHLV